MVFGTWRSTGERREVCNLSMKCTSYPFNGIKILCHTHEFHDFVTFLFLELRLEFEDFIDGKCRLF